MSIKSFKFNSLANRLILLVAILFSLFFVFLSLKWTFGNTIAKQAPTKEVAELSTKFAPNDPQTYFSLAALTEKGFLPEDFTKALEYYEKAASLSPNDFRLWMSLGKARERSGDGKGAEKAFRKALELAPNYSEVHWTLGNYLLRQGNSEEAFLEIRKAVEQDEKYANPAAMTAWQIFDGDLTQIANKIGDSASIKAGLAPFLAKQKRFDEAVSFWNTIPDADKRDKYKTNGEELFNQLIEAKSFRNALTLQMQLSAVEDEKAEVGKIFNGGFEKEIKSANAKFFDWKVGDAGQSQIAPDGGQKHGGERSLIMLFNSTTGKDLRTIQQTVVVEGSKNYKWEGFFRADLKTLGTLKWEIADANDGKILGSSNSVTNSAEWLPISADFTTLPDTQAVIIRLANINCKQGICPISGKLWFDDFTLR